jgi:hypothetical protein
MLHIRNVAIPAFKERISGVKNDLPVSMTPQNYGITETKIFGNGRYIF